ncbi:hypothetical protein [Streptomyces liliifuscus]|uniref:Uncharacterized protein n=1 Tax=Streptomyces liliifuscus TaxID=2797636 RepID=A0A7T7L201_9ACTN|nr:hypothetical protein [Streptomyces liliifuscus]QQM44974.1 hypothetical protein JEQ17_39955 [Streptomyces liliifuscus]
MTTVQDTYLGWDLLRHFKGCTRPQWTVDVRREDDAFRARHEGPKHECPNDACHHGDRYERTTVRIVCTSCQMAHVIRSEEGLHSSSTKNATHGYGQPPRKTAGLLLWPGEPLLGWGRLSTDEPWDFLITRPGVTRVTEADVVGVVNQVRGKRGAVRWSAVAVRSEAGPYGLSPLRFAHAEERMASVPAAAKWAAALLAGGAQ